jgi:hypothetical protein
MCQANFLKSGDYTHFLFIDSDIDFELLKLFLNVRSR